MLHGSGVVNLNHGRERMDGNKRGGLRVIGEDSRGLNGVDRGESGRIRGDRGRMGIYKWVYNGYIMGI